MDTRKMMRVTSVTENETKIVVETTGARYVFNKDESSGSIDCYQLLNKERHVARIDFAGLPFTNTTVQKKDDSTCLLSIVPIRGNYNDIRVRVNSDSLLDIDAPWVKMNVNVASELRPDYWAQEEGNVLLIDPIGGVGFYPYSKMSDCHTYQAGDWHIEYEFGFCARLLVSVFPPREFNKAQSVEERHYLRSWATLDGKTPISPYPSDAELEEAAKYTNILTLTDTQWQGRLDKKGIPILTRDDEFANVTCSVYDYVPKDARELARVVDKAHALGMKVLPYMSPFYSLARGRDFIDRVRRVIDTYSMDGVYFDGLPVDTLEAYDIVRGTKAMLGTKLLFMHTTGSPVAGGSYHLCCPFIDTYADHQLRAEHIRSFPEPYARYVISGYNISNTIGHVCYWGYPTEFVRQLIPVALQANARFPLNGHGAEIGPNEVLLKEEYFPKLVE